MLRGQCNMKEQKDNFIDVDNAVYRDAIVNSVMSKLKEITV